MGNKTWVFTGGAATRSSNEYLISFRNFVSLFEEFIRWHIAENETENKEKFVTNVGYPGQQIQDISRSFDKRIKPLHPNYIVLTLGYEDYKQVTDIHEFQRNIESLVKKAAESLPKDGAFIIFTLEDDGEQALENGLKIQAVLDELVSKSNQSFNVKLIRHTVNKKKMEVNQSKENQAHYEEFEKATRLIEELIGDDNNYQEALDFSLTATKLENEAFLPVMKKYSKADNNLKDLTELLNQEKALTWLFMGDSITQGALWTNGYNSISQEMELFLQDTMERSEDIVINTAVSGATTTSTIEHIEKRLDIYEPDIVSIMLGANDSVELTVKEFLDNLEYLLDKIRQKTKYIILRTPTPTYDESLNDKVKQYTDAIYDLVQKYENIMLVDHYSIIDALIDADPSLLKNEYTIFTDERKLHLGVNGQLLMFYSFLTDLGLMSKRVSYFYKNNEYDFNKEINKFIQDEKER